MKSKEFTFSFIEEMIRSKTFGVLTTLNSNNTPHTSGVLYGVSTPESIFELYIATSKKYRKTKNIIKNPSVSFLIPFPHHHLRFVPSGTVTIYGDAKIIPFDNEDILAIFSEKRILRLVTKNLNSEEMKDYVFIKIKPKPKILVYALGYSIWKLRGSHTEGGYSVRIPEKRL